MLAEVYQDVLNGNGLRHVLQIISRSISEDVHGKLPNSSHDDPSLPLILQFRTLRIRNMRVRRLAFSGPRRSP